MTTKTDITLLPCPCCGAPAVTGADAEYENSNGDPAVECSSCNVMSWTVEDWNRRAAVEADRRAKMSDNAACIAKLSESDKQDQFRDATKMVPSDEEILALAEDARVWVPMGSGPEKERSLQALRSLITTALSRYSSGQPAAPNVCGCCGGSGESTRLVGGGPDAHDELCLCQACGGTGDGQPAASAEVDAWRERFPAHEYRPQDGCVSLKLSAPAASAERTHTVEPKLDTPVAQEPAAYRVLRKTHDGEWKTDGRYWCDGSPSVNLETDIAKRSDNWRIEYVYAAPVAAQAQPVAFAKDGVLFWHGEHVAWRGFSGNLYLTAQAQPCNHVYEARPIDGSRRASVPVEAVCAKCGYRPAAVQVDETTNLQGNPVDESAEMQGQTGGNGHED